MDVVYEKQREESRRTLCFCLDNENEEAAIDWVEGGCRWCCVCWGWVGVDQEFGFAYIFEKPKEKCNSPPTSLKG